MAALATVAVVVVLAVALASLPMAGIWWHVARWAFYLPILLVSARYGSFSGLLAGVAVSLLCVFVAAARGYNSWPSIFAPDFALVGLLGGRFIGVWPRFNQLLSARAAARPVPGRIAERKLDFDLTPLSSIESAARLLAEEDAGADLRQELVGIIAKECKHLSSSIGGLLEKNREEAPAQVCDADMSAIIDAAVEEAEFVLCRRGVMIRKEIAPDLPRVECNPGQVRNLFVSLTVQAAQSAPAVNEVVLHAQRREDGVVLEINEQGQGPLARRIADQFFGPGPARVGVDLSTAYDIVRQHGGNIEGKINRSKGLVFSVWLPLRRNYNHGGWQDTTGRRR